MRIEVVDHDLLGNDLMGYHNIDLIDCLKNPQTWGINKIYDLDGDSEMRKEYKTEKFGQIYL